MTSPEFRTQWLATRALRDAGQRTRDQVIDELLEMLSDALLATQERLLALEGKVEDLIAGLTEEGNEEL